MTKERYMLLSLFFVIISTFTTFLGVQLAFQNQFTSSLFAAGVFLLFFTINQALFKSFERGTPKLGKVMALVVALTISVPSNFNVIYKSFMEASEVQLVQREAVDAFLADTNIILIAIREASDIKSIVAVKQDIEHEFKLLKAQFYDQLNDGWGPKTAAHVDKIDRVVGALGGRMTDIQRPARGATRQQFTVFISDKKSVVDEALNGTQSENAKSLLELRAKIIGARARYISEDGEEKGAEHGAESSEQMRQRLLAWKSMAEGAGLNLEEFQTELINVPVQIGNIPMTIASALNRGNYPVSIVSLMLSTLIDVIPLLCLALLGGVSGRRSRREDQEEKITIQKGLQEL